MNHYLGAVAAAVTIAMVSMASAQSADPKNQKFPDVVDVRVHARGDNRFDFDATLSSPYDSPQRYADAFRVMGNGGVVYGERTLFHDHASEQPFTRDLYGVTINTVTGARPDRSPCRGGRGVKDAKRRKPDQWFWLCGVRADMVSLSRAIRRAAHPPD
jgi:hypothetical protein